MQNHHPRASVLETVDGCRDAAAAVDEFIAAEPVDRNDRRVAQEAAEVQFFSFGDAMFIE